MATPAMSLMRSEMSFSRRIILGGVSLLLIILLSWFLLTVNYWLGMIFFFVSSLVFIRFYFKKYQARNLLLFLTFTLFVFVLVSSLSYGIIVNYPNAFPFIQNNLADQLSAAIMIGGFATLFGVILPFLLTVAVAAFGILKWHDKDLSISYNAAFSHLLSDVLGLFKLSVKVVDGELIGSERDLERLETFGGPGWLTVFPGYIVALHEWGKLTRVVGMGSTMLNREEQIKAILPLNPQGGINTIENVMTKDRVPLTVHVLHVAQMEPATETAERLGVDETDLTVGDYYNKIYESNARRVAIKAPKVWDGLKGPIMGNVKDAFMSINFDDLFHLTESENNGEIEISPDNRKIAAIEKLVKEKSMGSGHGKGLALRVVDISEIQFPEEIQKIINKEASSLVEASIKKIEARTLEETAEMEANIRIRKADAESVAKVTEARAEQTAAEYKTRAQLELARGRAQAEFLEGRGRATARAELYRRVIRTLREEGQSPETIQAILQSLARTNNLEDELKRLLQLTVHYIKGEHTGRAISDGNDHR